MKFMRARHRTLWIFRSISCGYIVPSEGKVEFSNLVEADRKKIISFLAHSDCLNAFLGNRGGELKSLLVNFENVMDVVRYPDDPETVRLTTQQFRATFLMFNLILV